MREGLNKCFGERFGNSLGKVLVDWFEEDLGGRTRGEVWEGLWKTLGEGLDKGPVEKLGKGLEDMNKERKEKPEKITKKQAKKHAYAEPHTTNQIKKMES